MELIASRSPYTLLPDSIMAVSGQLPNGSVNLGPLANQARRFSVVAHGLGRHASTLDIPTEIVFFKLLLGFECMYVTAVVLVKLSLLAMYLRIFPSREFKIGAWSIGGIVVAWGIAIVLVCIFQCDPIYVAWMPWEKGTCINLKASFIGNAVPNIVTDLAILCMPIKQVWNLHAKPLQKISLLCTFMLGSL
jgi:hypothetical protein